MRTGSSYALFGAGGALLALVVLPLARRLSGDRPGFDLRAQRWIHRAYRLFVAYSQRLGLFELRVTGLEHLRGPGPRLVVPNHPTLIDTPLLGALLPQADCVAKTEWAESRLLGPALAAADYIRRDTGSAVVEEGVRRLRQGRTVLIFPEGTRTPEGERIGRLHRGAAHIALRSGVPLLPVVITAQPRGLMKGQHWYDVPDGPLRIRIRVLPPLDPEGALSASETLSLAARTLTAELRRRLEAGQAEPARDDAGPEPGSLPAEVPA